MPCGNPQDIAQILALLLPQNVTADEIIMSIVSELKSGSGGVFRGVYLSPLTSPFDSKANWPFMEWCYIFDFDDVLSIESRELNGAWKKHNVKQFCDFC